MATLPLEDGRLWYESTGEGRPLVFVHGGWLNGRAWESQVERFAGDYRVITLDVRGHGQTGPTDVDRYSIPLFTDDLEALLDHLELDDPVLVGLSLGSMVVQEFLCRHPDRAAGAILAGPVRSMPPVAVPPGTKSLLTPAPALATSLSVAGPRATFRSMLGAIRTATGEPWLAADPEVRAAAVDGVGDTHPEEYRKIFDALYRYDPPTLSDVRTPTLAIYGAREAPSVKRQGREVAAEVETGDWVVVPDAAHLVNQDRPEAFNRIGTRFLDRLDAR